MAHQTVSRLFILCLFCITIVLSRLDPLWAGPYFEDGYLGLTQTELHDKLGLPQAVRDRKSALRVFTYYPITDWEQYFKKVASPENGEDVYTFKRDGIDVRYSFSYTFDPNDHNDQRPLFVRLVDIEFMPPVALSKVPQLVPEFKPSQRASLPFEHHAVVFRRKPFAGGALSCAGKGEGGLGLVTRLSNVRPAGTTRSADLEGPDRPPGDQHAEFTAGQAPPTQHPRAGPEPLLQGLRPTAASPADRKKDSGAQIRRLRGSGRSCSLPSRSYRVGESHTPCCKSVSSHRDRYWVGGSICSN